MATMDLEKKNTFLNGLGMLYFEKKKRSNRTYLFVEKNRTNFIYNWLQLVPVDSKKLNYEIQKETDAKLSWLSNTLPIIQLLI